MSYMTWAQLAAKYESAAKWANSDELASSYISQAQATINGALAAKYTVPFSPVPPMIQDLCVDLVYFMLAINKEADQAKAVKAWYDERIEQLQDGSLKLVQADGTVLPDQSNYASISDDHHSVFGPDSPVNWQPDTDALQDAEDARLSD